MAISNLLRNVGVESEHSASPSSDRRLSDVVDSSADPSPKSLTRLSVSMQSLLLGENSDCGLSRRAAVSTSTSSINEGQKPSLANLEDDFIDMLSRMQSKRINDQRCDPIILSDLTNRSKGVARQSDSVVCGVRSADHPRKSNRLSAIFDRVSKAARHTLLVPSSSFIPPSTSTPRLSTVKSAANDQRSVSATEFSTKPPLNAPLFDQSNVSAVSETDTEVWVDAVQSGPSSPRSLVSESSPLFRVPKVPPRNRSRAGRANSLSALPGGIRFPEMAANKRNGAEDMLDLIESLQGRRMEEQRAHLSVNAESVSVPRANSVEPKESSDEVRKTERSRSEDAHSLYEMLIRSQSDRLEEQRSELPSTIPDEDISQIVITMQKGRIEAQRAHLKPPDQQ
ncbi:G-protein-signaling modulator 1 [Toxocara canis]|uniref:G-protein-signaling modulator 1 n=1 Tax=Toxocara canis TaxID=6265 RepID=A0A0B2VVY2_TOXCA|nr:G-protein-signaling modulator 1 [Toxocara canis]